MKRDVGVHGGGGRHNRGMADVPCHTVEWTRLEIDHRSWRVKLEYG